MQAGAHCCHCVGSTADNSLGFLGQSRITAVAASDESGEMFHFNKMNCGRVKIGIISKSKYFFDGSMGTVILC